jgi:hypothetical protein
MIGLVGVAQAAAVLLAVGLAWRGFGPPPGLRTADLGTSASARLAARSHGPDGQKLVNIHVPAGSFPTVVEEGRLVVIHADSKPRNLLVPIFSSATAFVIEVEGLVPAVVDCTPDEMSFGVDDWYLVFNAMESLANPVVVMKE